MRKTSILVLFCTLLCLSVFAGIFSDKTNNLVSRVLGREQVGEKMSLTDKSPADIAKYFWQASKKGEFQTLNDLITKTPASYWSSCEASSENSPDNKANKTPLLEAEDEKFREKIDTGKVFEEDQFSLLKQHSKTINLSQFNELTVKNEYIYGDEAIVEAQYEITKDYVIHEIFFLHKEESTWKIFIVSSLEKSIYNENYAKTRPRCLAR